jgi:hypothetical protein
MLTGAGTSDPEGAQRIASRRLNFDDRRPHVRENAASGRNERPGGDLDYLDTL